MDIKPLLKVTLAFTLCVIMHRLAYTRFFMADNQSMGGLNGY
ncbi:hypothetical protein [Shewanella piezotolerans]|nr:hypothetical protein [Shewanella piezotolerans]